MVSKVTNNDKHKIMGESCVISGQCTYFSSQKDVRNKTSSFFM